jgi:hypothetical protein
VNPRLAALLTGAHASAWRRRYGPEFRALLEELPGTPAVIASASSSALSSRAPALATVGAVAFAAALLALGPAASDRRDVVVQKHWTAPVSCSRQVANNEPDGWGRC